MKLLQRGFKLIPRKATTLLLTFSSSERAVFIMRVHYAIWQVAVFCSSVLAQSDNSFEPGDTVVVVQDCTVNAGFDAGRLIRQGTVGVIGCLKEDQIWLSGPCSGWVSSISLLNAEKAKRELIAQKPDERKDPDSIARLVHLQILSSDIDSLDVNVDRIRKCGSVSEYATAILALAELFQDQGKQSGIDSFCRKRIDDSTASLLVAVILNTGRVDVLNKVLQATSWNESTSSVDVLLGAGWVAYKVDNNPDKAINLLTVAIKKDPYNGRLLCGRGMMHIGANRLDEGLKDLEKSVALWPRNRRSLEYLGAALIQKGSTERATAILTECRTIGPRNHALSELVGERFLRKAENEEVDAEKREAYLTEAVKQFEEACKLSKYSHMICVAKLCKGYAEQGRHIEAMDLLDELERSSPRDDTRRVALDAIRSYVTEHYINRLEREHTNSL